MKKTIVLILAAGKSERFGEGNKLFAPIQGKDLLYYTVQAFENHASVDEIFLIGNVEDQNMCQEFKNRHNFEKIKAIVSGGKERQDSVFNGIQYLQDQNYKSDTVVMVHNGANPLVSQKEITEVLQAQKEFGSAVVGKPLVDTIKVIDSEGCIQKGIKRDQIWAMQTPQTSTLEKFVAAFDNLYYPSRNNVTDEAEALELIGETVKIVRASDENVKITSKFDLELCRKVILERSSDEEIEGMAQSKVSSDMIFEEEGLSSILNY